MKEALIAAVLRLGRISHWGDKVLWVGYGLCAEIMLLAAICNRQTPSGGSEEMGYSKQRKR